MPALLHSRAAATASSSFSPATNRRAIRRVVPLEVTQLAKLLLSESLRSVDRSMRNYYGSVGKAKLAFVLFQKLFCVQGGHATGACSGDGLAVAVVLHVTGNENTGNRSEAAVPGEQVAVGIHFEFSLEDDGVRIVTDGNEYAIERNLMCFLVLLIAKTHALDVAFGSENLLQGERSDEFNFLVRPGTVDHDLGSAKIIPAVNQMDLAGVTRQKVGLFHGGITAANHGDGLAAEEIAVAGRTGGNAVSDQFSFASQPQQSRGGPRGDDQSPRFVGILSGNDLERALTDVDFRYRAGFELGSESLRLLAHVFDELRPHNAVGEAGIVLNVRGEGKLAAGLVPVQDERLQVRAPGVDGGSETGAAAADDEDVVHSIFLHLLDSVPCPPDTTERIL